MDGHSVSRVVDLLLGLESPQRELALEVTDCFQLTDTDWAWLMKLLTLSINNRSASVRSHAVQALGALAGIQALRFIQGALQDEDEDVRWVTQRTISRLETLGQPGH